MSFARVVDQVRMEFVLMPELELTLPQAIRLWKLGMDDCRFVIDALVDTGFLAWTPRRTVIRRTGAAGRGPEPAYISVASRGPHDKSVDM